MRNGPEAFTATIEGQFGEEYRITLVRQPDGHYEESYEAPDTNAHQDQDMVTATVEGRFGEEHKITLVRQPDGSYREAADASQPVSL